ncbi:glycosyl transferases group 1 [Variibacter gotjawalensis]|uniref:Glycosyl transferases group 1 n=1 Tax=Variibacter gotjawalensis TaxID=1333996 RepID=A0A0S3PNR4_9BRAD|nr:glycosyltransferase family 4 protein [Variibacter gotjawalensis]NIK47884.1 glycosyltransferase involved in cell wall biosynthesis [Variibacter gotjawalensis]RZS49763.1 glycosyltransferase involved in cell wall biosynthesis [Variibacter gotjawalensis]BAT57592.1 glycosyl transferases group 1 [Variibacter gotjawalensis]
MRILWLTPVHRRSAIANFSELVVERLIARGFEVAVAASETEFDSRERRAFLDLKIRSVREWSPQDFDQHNDVIFANFGDHYPNHALSLLSLKSKRVIGIFHDADMTNFENGYRALGKTDGIDFQFSAPSIISAIAQKCAGAVAHSNFYKADLDACDGPIAVVPLAWALKNVRARSALTGERFRLVTFGNINRNKCADRIIAAIGGSRSLSDAVDYLLLGAIAADEKARLEALATDANVRLSIMGEVSDEELVRALQGASAVSCLRHPVLEGASASAIEAMLHGCAVLVSNAGFYRDLPDDCVAKVPAETSVSALRTTLESLVSDVEGCVEMGKRASAYASRAFSPDTYAASMIELAKNVSQLSAYNPLIAKTGLQLARLGLQSDHPAVDLVLSAVESLPGIRRRRNLS